MTSGRANDALRAARLARSSPSVPTEPMSRAELAHAVNVYLWQTTRRQYALDAHTVARYERGVVRWPGTAYRSALRAVLGASTDAELGFTPTQRGAGAAGIPTLDRRDLLVTGLAGLAANALPSRAGSVSLPPDEFAVELTALHDLDRLHGPLRAMAGITTLLALLDDDLRDRNGSDRRTVLRSAARAAEFAGFLHRDLGDSVRCRYWHDRAMEWAQQSGDVSLEAYVLLCWPSLRMTTAASSAVTMWAV